MKYIIDSTLANTLQWNKNVIFLDCRFQLANPSYGFEAYLQNHIPLSRYVDLNKDLSSEVKQHGGRHPLPDLEEFGQLLGKLGIDQNTIVICYDDGTNENAARCWFLCKLVGQKFTFVLNGGYTKWVESGFEITSEIVDIVPKKFVVNSNNQIVSSMLEVKSNSQSEKVNIVDSRELIRFKGEHEPIDKVAGHIPGAKHSFWKDVLNENGDFKSKEELEILFAHLSKEKETIVYCGSGVTGCVNYLGLIEAGYRNVKLYAGSFSDWISYDENDVNKIN
ncbi:sulfurtransferase [Bacillus sp. EAC]|uniref:sulfurtransferase n=1 Tax=Bacillus sp. EAC TaxID=1978338 RepID=UPI00211B5C59|nr:sulfurtransferase [Bacillus sp. EAC]